MIKLFIFDIGGFESEIVQRKLLFAFVIFEMRLKTCLLKKRKDL